MKNNIFKTIIRGLIFAALTGLLSISALAAGLSMDLSKTAGYPGDSVTVSGTAEAGKWVSVKMVGEDGSIVYYGAVISDSEGNYSDTFKIPKLDPGDFLIIAGYGSTVENKTYTVRRRTSDSGLDGKQDITIGDSEGNTTGGTRTEAENGARVDIPRAGFNNLAEKSDGNVTIDLGLAKVTFGGRAMESISETAESGDISLTVERVDSSSLPAKAQARIGDRPVYDFTLKAGDTQISDFDGKATISVPYTLGPGENPRSVVIYYIDDSGALKSVRGKYNAQTGTVDFTVTHFSVYAVGYNYVSFSDVADTAWYRDAVSFCAAREITKGTGNEMFSPGDTLTRGQFITMLMRANGIEADVVITDNFDDAGDTYYTGYLAAAKRLGIAGGVGNNLFAPEREVTRQDMFTLLYRALDALEELPEASGAASLSDFGDAENISDYAAEAVETLVSAGIVSGSNGNLNPLGSSTRAQLVTVLYNLLSK